MIEDAELAAAIDGARGRLGAGQSKAAVVRELALRGWRDLEAEQDRQRGAADQLIAIIDEGLLDFDAVDAVRRRDPSRR